MHAALITAYKEFPLLLTLLDELQRRNIKAFLHLDAKMQLSDRQIQELGSRSHLSSKRQYVYWGSYSHLQAIVELARKALTHPEVTYLHTISGQDFPVADFSRVDRTKVYMDAAPFQNDIEMVRDRVHYRKIFHRIEHLRPIYRPLNKLAFMAQKQLGRKRMRSRFYPEIYKGLVWFSLPSAALRYAIESPAAVSFLDEVRSYYLPEEFFFQTVLMNSQWRESVVATNRRFIDWDTRHGNKPAVLDASDATAILASDCLFARKFDAQISRELIEILAKGNV